jgi:hypothetical protein
MECPSGLCPLEEPNLFRSFGINYLKPRIFAQTSVLLITLRPIYKLRERVTMIIEDMLRAYALRYGGS